MPGNTTGQTPTLDELRAAVAAIIGLAPDSIPDDANLIHLGMDSLGMMRLVNRWRREGIRVSSRELSTEPTLSAWQRHLRALRAATVSEQPGLPDAGLPGSPCPR
jgi:aryl carrier-like protein